MTPTVSPRAGVLAVKVSVPGYLWKVEAMEVLGGWVIVILEILNEVRPASQKKKEKKAQTKRKDKANENVENLRQAYAPKPEGIKIQEIVDGHVSGRGVRELPLWGWAADMKHVTEVPAVRAYRRSSGEGGSREQRPRHLLSIRVRKDAMTDMLGFETFIKEMSSPVDSRLDDAKEILVDAEKELTDFMAVLEGGDDLANDDEISKLDNNVEALQSKFVGLGIEVEGTDADQGQIVLAEYEGAVQKLTELRNLQFVRDERKRLVDSLEKERKDRGTWMGIGKREWDE
jgi:hypothetical protein